MEFATTFPLSGNGTDFWEFGYTGSSGDISGCWIAATVCVSGARHNIMIILHGTFVTVTWTVYILAMLVLLMVRNWKTQSLRGLKWYGTHAKFHENVSDIPKSLGDAVSLSLFKGGGSSG
jgi:hypothetical protein